MPTFSLTDNARNPVPLPVDWTQLSGLNKYLKSEVFHLIVLPDILDRKDQPLSQLTPQPFRARLKAANDFQLGDTQPEIDFTPAGEISLETAATPGSNLFEDDSFPLTAAVPPDTAYAGLSLEGGLTLGVSGSSGDLTFGIERTQTIRLGYWRAFPGSGPAQPTLGAALASVISNFLIPRSPQDLSALRPHDICTVSGAGSLKISGGVKVKASPNPLASATLPLNLGAFTVQEGVMTGLSAALTLKGSYQIRARALDSATVELSFLQQKGAGLKVDLTASGGVKAQVGGKELISLLLGAIDPHTDNTQLLNGGLTPDEAAQLNDAVKDALDHSLQVAFDQTLSLLADDQAAFQYHLDLAALAQNEPARDAVQRALQGDLSGLTALEPNAGPDAALAPGIKLVSSLFTQSEKRGAVLHVNLLGLLNVTSLAELLRKSTIVKDPVSGDLTITDTATGTQIEAIAEPPKREERLRQAIFESMLLTAAYKASGAVESFNLTTQFFHFAQNQNTNPGILRDYLNWLSALNLIAAPERQSLEAQLQSSGPSTCLLRTMFTDAQCRALFFDEHGALRPEAYYLDYGRRAMLALLNDQIGPCDRYRYNLLDQHWQRAFEVGPSRELAEVAGLTRVNPNFEAILSQLIGDVYDIAWWASAMVQAGQELQAMNTFLNGRTALSLRDDPAFTARRDALSRRMSEILSRSRARFHEPWGMVSLFWAAGSPAASAAIVTASKRIARP